MNTHDIELPPLPKASKMHDIPGYDEEELKDYARAAIEADRKRRGEPGLLMIQEADTIPHFHPEYGPGIFFTEDAVISPRAPQPAEPHQGYQPIQSGQLPPPPAPQPAEPVKGPSLSDLLELADAALHDATRESWMGMRVAAYQWEIDADFGKMTRHATHWSAAPQDAERLYRESDVRALLDRYGRGQK